MYNISNKKQVKFAQMVKYVTVGDGNDLDLSCCWH